MQDHPPRQLDAKISTCREKYKNNNNNKKKCFCFSGRYSDSVDSVDIWPEHVEALQRQRYLEQPMGQDQGYLEQPEEHNYLEQIFLEHPEDQIYLEQPQDQGYLEPQADDLSYPVASQDQSYNDEEEEVVGSYLQQHPEASNYLEEPRAGLESWYHQSSSGSQAVEEDGQLEEELHAAEKEKRSSENMEGYRLYQVCKTFFLSHVLSGHWDEIHQIKSGAKRDILTRLLTSVF